MTVEASVQACEVHVMTSSNVAVLASAPIIIKIEREDGFREMPMSD